MAQVVELKATAKPRAGKGAARQVRREGKVPGVIYGAGQPPLTVALDYNELWKQYLKGHFLSTVINVTVDGTANRVIPREMQLDPVRDLPIHVDFQRIGADGKVRVGVPVKFVNEGLSPGLKRGGVLNVVRHEVEFICPADAIPAFIEANLEGLEIGRSVHISAIKLPPGITPVIKNRDFTIATIAGALQKEEEPVPGAATATAEGAAAAPGAAPAAAGDAKAAPADAKAAAGGAKAPAAGGKGAPAAPAAAPAKGGDKKK
jgi:large subunit ribosomal protein L25